MVWSAGALAQCLAAGGVRSRDAGEHRESSRDVMGFQRVFGRDELCDLQVLLCVSEPLRASAASHWRERVSFGAIGSWCSPEQLVKRYTGEIDAVSAKVCRTGGLSSRICRRSCSRKSMMPAWFPVHARTASPRSCSCSLHTASSAYTGRTDEEDVDVAVDVSILAGGRSEHEMRALEECSSSRRHHADGRKARCGSWPWSRRWGRRHAAG